MPRRLDRNGGSPEEVVIYERSRGLLPGWLRRYVLHFEAAIEDAVGRFAASLPAGARGVVHSLRGSQGDPSPLRRTAPRWQDPAGRGAFR